MAEKRGPKIGDAASLWNFTPSPGWTKEEAHILKLCLMKYGVGRWVQILDSGLLPGKLIQQLNGQTQRLLGQQSLAAYTGLRVDIDRIRQDNEGRDAQRKSGLIIYDGPNLTKEMKEKLQEESRLKYGLTQEHMDAVDAQLEQIRGEKMKKVDEMKIHREQLASMKNEVFMTVDELEGMGRAEKIELLVRLAESLRQAHTLYKYHLQLSQQHVFSRHKVGSGRENKTSNGDVVRTLSGSKNKEARISRQGQPKKRRTAPVKKAAVSRRRSRSTDVDDDEFVDGYDVSIARECQRAGIEANVDTLMAMGFERRQVIDALEEANGSIEMAVEWLTVHCI